MHDQGVETNVLTFLMDEVLLHMTNGIEMKMGHELQHLLLQRKQEVAEERVVVEATDY